MNSHIRAEDLKESDLDYILSLNNIETTETSLCMKKSQAQKFLTFHRLVAKNLMLDINTQESYIRKVLKELEKSIMAFRGRKSDSLYKIILNRLIYVSKVIKYLELSDETDVHYRYLKDEYIAKSSNLKVSLNKKIQRREKIVSAVYNKLKIQDLARFKQDFDYIRKLGEGGFGIVVAAKHKYDGGLYAIKRVNLSSERSKSKAVKEAKALAKLNHGNIVRYYTCWTDDVLFDFETLSSDGMESSDSSKSSKTRTDSGNPHTKYTTTRLIPKSSAPYMHFYIQMELCQKNNLYYWLKMNNERNYDHIMDIFMQILDAVVYIHSQKFIHRDLKPGNILFSLDGKIKVGDFGLGLDVGILSLAPGGAYGKVGTVFYMSPELDSGIYDYKVDIYALEDESPYGSFTPIMPAWSMIAVGAQSRIDVPGEQGRRRFIWVYNIDRFKLYNGMKYMYCDIPENLLSSLGEKSLPL